MYLTAVVEVYCRLDRTVNSKKENQTKTFCLPVSTWIAIQA